MGNVIFLLAGMMVLANILRETGLFQWIAVQADGVEPWDAEQSNWLPPAYVGDALAGVTFTGFPTLTYRVELDGLAVYSGTAVAQGAYMPLRSFTAWAGHWVLEVDDHLIMDGQDLGQTLGYDVNFGFSLIRGQPFYFFERESKVRISCGGRTLPNAYDQVGTGRLERVRPRIFRIVQFPVPSYEQLQAA
jgi:hypothetical protein